MIEITEIFPKKRIISILSAILIFSVVFAVIIIKDTRRMQNYYDHTSEITYNDSIDLIVNNVWVNHGYLFFNNKYYLSSSRVIKTSIYYSD